MGKYNGNPDGKVKVTSDEVVENIKLSVDDLGNAINQLNERGLKYAVLVGKLAPLVSDEDLDSVGINRADLDQFISVNDKKERV